MKPRDAAALAARVLIGAVLIYAGASKAAAPVEEFATVVQSYGILGSDMSLSTAAVLPWLELVVGWALLLGVQTRAAATAAAALFAVFLTALGSALLRKIPLPNCGCYGDGLHFSTGHAFLLDCGLAALCALCWSAGPGPASVDAWVERGR
jgi:uncharacterized membrane protein YphA (DoxX/SURF4 family)